MLSTVRRPKNKLVCNQSSILEIIETLVGSLMDLRLRAIRPSTVMNPQVHHSAFPEGETLRRTVPFTGGGEGELGFPLSQV